MPPIIMRASLLTLLVASIPVGAVQAQSPPAPKPAEDPQKGQEDRIRRLEEEVAALKAAQAAPKTEPVQLGGAGGAATKALNPDISVIGDFIPGKAGAN